MSIQVRSFSFPKWYFILEKDSLIGWELIFGQASYFLNCKFSSFRHLSPVWAQFSLNCLDELIFQSSSVHSCPVIRCRVTQSQWFDFLASTAAVGYQRLAEWGMFVEIIYVSTNGYWCYTYGNATSINEVYHDFWMDILEESGKVEISSLLRSILNLFT